MEKKEDVEAVVLPIEPFKNVLWIGAGVNPEPTTHDQWFNHYTTCEQIL